MARRMIRDEFVGRVVLVNDVDGNGYEGALVSYDDSGLRLVGVAAEKVLFIDGEDVSRRMGLGHEVFLPAARVMLVVPRAS